MGKVKLTDAQRRALRLTDHGRATLIVRPDDIMHQPSHILDAIRELPVLVSMGLRTSEELAPGVTKYSLTKSGRAALRSDTDG